MSLTMKLFRVGPLVHDGRFTQIPNSIIRSKTLSRSAIGTLVYLLSHDNSYNASVSVAAMAKEFKEGRDAIQRSIKELEQAGYVRTVNAKWMDGQPRWVRFVSSDPSTLERCTEQGEIPFDSKSVLYYDTDENIVRRSSGKPVRPINGKPVRPINGKPVRGVPENLQDPSTGKPVRPPIENTNREDQEEKSAPELLLSMIHLWNQLDRKGLVRYGIDPQNPSKSLSKAFRRFSTDKRFEDVREALRDLDEVYKKLLKAKNLHNEPFFCLEWLLTTAPNRGEFAAVKLMKGFYDEWEGKNGAGKSGGNGGSANAVQSSGSRVRSPNRSQSVTSEKV